LAHSTHAAGIHGGFNFALPLRRGGEAFESLAADILQTWCSALANPAGHGISLAICRDADPSPTSSETLQRVEHAAHTLAEQIQQREGLSQAVDQFLLSP